MIITISDTSKNQTKRIDFDNTINLSRLRNVPLFCAVYGAETNRSKEGLVGKELTGAVQAMQDDGRILGKILEGLAISLSPELKEQVDSGDLLRFGSNDVTDEWVKSCTILGYVRRHLVGKDMMKAILDLVGIFDGWKEMLTGTCNKRLRMFRNHLKETLVLVELRMLWDLWVKIVNKLDRTHYPRTSP